MYFNLLFIVYVHILYILLSRDVKDTRTNIRIFILIMSVAMSFGLLVGETCTSSNSLFPSHTPITLFFSLNDPHIIHWIHWIHTYQRLENMGHFIQYADRRCADRITHSCSPSIVVDSHDVDAYAMIEYVVFQRATVKLFQWCRWLLYYLYANISDLGEWECV